MLAGALFNRATDVLTKAVELQALGIEIGPDNALMRQCGDHLQEALSLGRLVLHRSGEEGIDELWGEPLKAFAFPIEDFYKSRYIKIARHHAGHRSDRRRADRRRSGACGPSTGSCRPSRRSPRAAKVKCETLQTDPTIFEAWSAFVTAGERLLAFQPRRLAARVDRRAAADLAGPAADRGGQGSGHARHARAGADAEEHARVPRAGRALSRGLGAPAAGPGRRRAWVPGRRRDAPRR